MTKKKVRPSFAGFQKFCKERNIDMRYLDEKRKADYYKEYVRSI